GGRVFKRGFSLSSGEKVLIVDDVLTTGRSLREVIALVKSYGAEIVGIGVFLDRSSGKNDFGCQVEALTSVSADSWEPEDCPLCKDGKPLTQRGSRDHSSANISKN
ncbi:MAG: orotate phosphoribosyltransferase, partial [candidate division Zixibacteria bacterium]|nr:orotate phosphoribosyltransferase [candidate division Zixibacteria bacterium]